MRVRISAALTALLLAGPACAAPPLVLYDAAAPALGADLTSSTTYQAGQTAPCGLATPCTDLNTTARASVAAPFLGGIPYGMSGVASAGVSNHGQGGSIGVLAWIKPTEDTTVYLGLTVGASRWNGQRIRIIPVPPRP